MEAELTAILEIALEEVYWATCPEIPGANGQGKTIEKAKEISKNAYIDVDCQGEIISMTIEHAKRNACLQEFSYQEISQSLA
ncbi:MAG: hypothetical protein GC158_13255 [Cyanobacteria bacterium RI_101]|nr:hypothetical protein [Cyanobacteria bacterium RI_101]